MGKVTSTPSEADHLASEGPQGAGVNQATA
jgi:hypothetical protein